MLMKASSLMGSYSSVNGSGIGTLARGPVLMFHKGMSVSIEPSALVSTQRRDMNQNRAV
jgi:hypothetical protein